MNANATYTIERRSEKRFMGSDGHLVVNKAAWIATFPDGRTFTNGNKATVVKLARLYSEGGEVLIAKGINT
jgi:hypothetical protein